MLSLRSQFFRYRMKVRTMFAAAEPPLTTVRAQMDEYGASVPLPANTQVADVCVHGLKSEWLTPPMVGDQRTILYLHGGGYVLGSCASHRAWVSHIAHAAHARVLLLDYRLAPEHPFPAAVDDAVAAYRWLLAEGVDPHNLVIAGDSAGGGLALAVLLTVRNAGDPLPAAAALISPWTDLAMTGKSMKTRAWADPMLKPTAFAAVVQHYCGEPSSQHPLISPLYADLHGLPPMLIHVGNCEVLLDDSTRLAERARTAGVETTINVWGGMWHVFHAAVVDGIHESRVAIAEMGQFIQAYTPRKTINDQINRSNRAQEMA